MVARKVEQFFGRTPIVRINPDEVVALGAAIQASLLDRTKQRSAEAVMHPRISDDSVVQELPEEEGPPSEDVFGLPVVGGPKPPAPAAVPPALPVVPVAPPPATAAPPVAPPPAVEPPAPAPAASKATQFLPGRSGTTLIFHVPAPKPRRRRRSNLPSRPRVRRSHPMRDSPSRRRRRLPGLLRCSST